MNEILFCSDAIHKYMVEEDYHEELKAVDELGIIYGLFDFDMAVDDGKYSSAVKNINKSDETRTAIYRGWMLSIEQYQMLYDTLLCKGVKLINNPSEYGFCHWLPNCYDVIEHRTPKSVWKHHPIIFAPDVLRNLLKPFSNSPIILKDYVKSAKHYWNTACFIPDASDIDKVIRTMREFCRVRDGVTGGFVFRQYVELEHIGVHPLSKIPIANEYRLFFLNGNLIDVSPYWEEGKYHQEELPLSEMKAIAQKVNSNFFSMDIAKTCASDWIIIELGDGQVSGLPVGCDIKKFYRKISE